MSFFVVVGAVVIFLLAHEFGHAQVLKQLGFRVPVVGLGIPIPFLPKFRISFKHPKWFYGARFYIYPLPLAAFVGIREKTLNELESLSIGEQALVYGAGPWASIIYGVAFLAIDCLVRFKWTASTVCVLTFLSLYFFKKWFCVYGVMGIGIASLLFICYDLSAFFFYMFSPRQNNVLNVYNEVQGMGLSFVGSLELASLMSIGLGIGNSLPLLPLDGGKIARVLLMKLKAPHYFMVAYNFLTPSLCILVILLNLLAIITGTTIGLFNLKSP